MLAALLALLALSDLALPAALAQTDRCPYGCILADDGDVYVVERSDVVWFARTLTCEVGAYIPGDEAQAVAWALVQNRERYHRAGRDLTLASLVTSYSACTSRDWSSAGTRYHPRITPRADATRAMRWRDIPRRVRAFALGYLRGAYPNRWPGWVYVFTAGRERHADRSWVGPYYTRPPTGRSRNAYWQDKSTAGWTWRSVRIVPGGSGLDRLAAQ
jgi:hypothetical protein